MADLETVVNALPDSAFESTWEKKTHTRLRMRLMLIFVVLSIASSLIVFDFSEPSTDAAPKANESRSMHGEKRRKKEKLCWEVACWSENGVFEGKLRRSLR